MLYVVEKNVWMTYDDHENQNFAGLQESITLWG